MKLQSHRRSPLALAILALLYEAPMHPYRMQQLIKDRGKDQVVNVRERASVYQTIERLLREGLIAITLTTRDEKRPERTVYQLTEEGRETLRDWMREMLSTPAREFPAFPAALSFLPLLTPEDVLHQLEARIVRLEIDLAANEAAIAASARFLPRLLLLDNEYTSARLRTELEWVRALADDLRAGRITWSEEELRSLVERTEGESQAESGSRAEREKEEGSR
jgi:DNA-binding PadR family transcriptional regulator